MQSSVSQFGFRKNKSTEIALMTRKEIIFTALEKNKIAIEIFKDFIKEFEHITHELQITKLNRYGIRSEPAQLI